MNKLIALVAGLLFGFGLSSTFEVAYYPFWMVIHTLRSVA